MASLGRFLFLGLILIGAFGASAQVIDLAPAKPNPRVHYDRLKRVDDLMTQFVQEKKIPGAVLLVLKDGQVLRHQAYGMDDADALKPMAKEALFRIASQTKAVTSVGVMMLLEEGKLLLTDPVSKYIPAFAKPVVLDKFNAADSSYTTVPAKREITIKDLLTHTSGLGYAQIGSPTMNAIYAKNQITAGIGELKANLQETMARLGKAPLEYQPGTRWNYSLSSDVLGYVIEVVSGMSLEAFFQQRLFTPLGMKDTHFNVPASKHSRLTALNTQDSLGSWHKIPDSPDFPASFPNQTTSYFSGGAGLTSTALDYGIFLQMLLNKGRYGGKTILSPRIVEMMTVNQVGKLMGERQFGLGFGIVPESAPDEVQSPGTFSWGGAFATNYWADPQKKIVFQLMTQQYPASPYLEELRAKLSVAIYQSLK